MSLRTKLVSLFEVDQFIRGGRLFEVCQFIRGGRLFEVSQLIRGGSAYSRWVSLFEVGTYSKWLNLFEVDQFIRGASAYSRWVSLFEVGQLIRGWEPITFLPFSVIHFQQVYFPSTKQRRKNTLDRASIYDFRGRERERQTDRQTER